LGVILEASLFGSTGVPPVNPFKLKNLVGLGILVIILPTSRCFGLGTQWVPAIRCRCQRAKEEASSMTSPKLLS
jgi:hypothetical protein